MKYLVHSDLCFHKKKNIIYDNFHQLDILT